MLKKQKEIIDSHGEQAPRQEYVEPTPEHTEPPREYRQEYVEPPREHRQEPVGPPRDYKQEYLEQVKVRQRQEQQERQKHQEYLEQAKTRHRERQAQEQRRKNGWDEPVVEVIKLPSEQMSRDLVPAVQPLTYRHQQLDWDEPIADSQPAENDDGFLDIS